MKKSVLASAIVMAFSVSAAYAGTVIDINPDAGGIDPVIAVGGLGWNDGNAISIGATPAVEDSIVQTYAHAALANFNDEDGNSIFNNLNNLYEWTYVTGFQEQVVSVSGPAPFNTAVLAVVGGGDNFFRIYYDAARNSNNLTGAGFNDGTLILSGSVLPFTGGEGLTSFTTSAQGGALDQFINNDYPGITSVTGIGTSNLEVRVAIGFADPLFFTSTPTELLINFDTFQNTPYQSQNPSACFNDGLGNLINGAGGQGTTCVNSVGTNNGVTGPNFMFQTRASNDFNAVPEPASLALLGAGLIGLGFARRRKNQA